MFSEKELQQVKEELQPLLPIMKKAATSIKDEEISNYPVFIVYKEDEEIGLGIPLLDENQMKENWGVNASTLEELATKKVVAMENVERFCDIYKTHPNSICFLVWNKNGAQIVFLPLIPQV